MQCLLTSLVSSKYYNWEEGHPHILEEDHEARGRSQCTQIPGAAGQGLDPAFCPPCPLAHSPPFSTFEKNSENVPAAGAAPLL